MATTTKFTKLVSFRVELELLEVLEREVVEINSKRIRKMTLSALLNDVIRARYFG